MKHKSRFLLPILTLLTFGVVAGSVVVENFVNKDAIEAKVADADTPDTTIINKLWFYIASNNDNSSGWGDAYAYVFIQLYGGKENTGYPGFCVNHGDTGHTKTYEIDISGYEGFTNVVISRWNSSKVTVDKQIGPYSGWSDSGDTWNKDEWGTITPNSFNTISDNHWGTLKFQTSLDTSKSNYSYTNRSTGWYLMGTGLNYSGSSFSSKFIIDQAIPADSTTVGDNTASWTGINLGNSYDYADDKTTGKYGFKVVKYTQNTHYGTTVFHNLNAYGRASSAHDWISGGGNYEGGPNIQANTAGKYNVYKSTNGTDLWFDRLFTVPVYVHTNDGVDTFIRNEEDKGNNQGLSPTVPNSPTGYGSFIGWKIGSASGSDWSSGSYPESADPLYALYTPNNYTVTFNPSSGSVDPTSKSVTYDSTYGSLPTPTRSGYSFGGWFTESGGGGTEVTSSTSVKILANQTLFAKWTANNYTVTFNKQGGIGGSNSVSATYDSSMPSVIMPTRTGYAFMGYYDTSAATGGTQYYTSTGASARTWNKENNTTLYARWEYCFDFNVPLTGGVGLTLTFNSTFTTQHPNINKVVVCYPNPDKIEGDEDRTLTKEFTSFGAMYVGVNAAQLTEDITFEIYENSAKTVEGSVTIADVVKTKHDAGNTSTKNLCGALLAYGTYVQTAFSYNTSNLAIDVLDNAELENTYLSFISSANLADDGRNLGTHTGLFEDTSKFVISAGMNTTTVFRFYFECDEAELSTLSATLTKPEGTAFELSELKSETITVNGVRVLKRYYEVSGIKPTEIKSLFTLNITKTGTNAGTLAITYSVGSYLYYLNQNSGVGAVYKNLAKATERYYYYASAYAA